MPQSTKVAANVTAEELADSGVRTVNVVDMPVDMPPGVVTKMDWAPSGAPAAMVRVAVSEVELVTITFEAVMPDMPLKLIVVFPTTKLVPVSVIITLVPCTPLVILTPVTVGRGGFTVKDWVPEVPPSVVTDTFPEVAEADMVNVAVI